MPDDTNPERPAQDRFTPLPGKRPNNPPPGSQSWRRVALAPVERLQVLSATRAPARASEPRRLVRLVLTVEGADEASVLAHVRQALEQTNIQGEVEIDSRSVAPGRAADEELPPNPPH